MLCAYRSAPRVVALHKLETHQLCIHTSTYTGVAQGTTLHRSSSSLYVSFQTTRGQDSKHITYTLHLVLACGVTSSKKQRVTLHFPLLSIAHTRTATHKTTHHLQSEETQRKTSQTSTINCTRKHSSVAAIRHSPVHMQQTLGALACHSSVSVLCVLVGTQTE